MLRWLTALGVCLAAGIVAVGILVLADLRRDTWRQASVTAENLAIVLNQDIARNLAMYDLSIQGARDAVMLPGLDDVSPDIRHMTIFDRAATAEYLGSLLVLKPDGSIFADSTSTVPHELFLGDRDYFVVHRDRADAGLFVSAPFQSRLRNGDPSIALSRRIDRPDGSFGGVVVGTLRLAYFQSLFGTIDIGAGGSVTILRNDGQMIARKPPATREQFARSYANASAVQHVTQGLAGQYTANSAVDTVERLFTVQQIGTLPILLSLAISTDYIYAPWRQKALALGSMMGLLFIGNLGLCLLFRRELKRRLEAEAALTVAAEELAVIATTDALTGIANRRAFDAALHRAWRGAARTHTGLALLMIDADCFKLFNDQFGHPAGDTLLRRVAGCVDNSIRRPNDIAARYGGEEFVALLADTEASGALVIAERIRQAVAAMEVPNPGSPAGFMSVSIGVAAMFPQVGETQSQLLALADAALFDAKRAGRNRVMLEESAVAPDGLLDILPGRGAYGVS